jgi:hypothetical protein
MLRISNRERVLVSLRKIVQTRRPRKSSHVAPSLISSVAYVVAPALDLDLDLDNVHGVRRSRIPVRVARIGADNDVFSVTSSFEG